MARGGKREGAGRKVGALNKATDDVRALAREYSDVAIKALVAVVKGSDSDAARVSAANAILDRAYGKPSQVVAGDPNEPLRHVHKIVLEGVESGGSEA